MSFTNKQKRLFAIRRNYAKKNAAASPYDRKLAGHYADYLGHKNGLSSQEKDKVYRETLKKVKTDSEFRRHLDFEFGS